DSLEQFENFFLRLVVLTLLEMFHELRDARGVLFDLLNRCHPFYTCPTVVDATTSALPFIANSRATRKISGINLRIAGLSSIPKSVFTGWTAIIKTSGGSTSNCCRIMRRFFQSITPVAAS